MKSINGRLYLKTPSASLYDLSVKDNVSDKIKFIIVR